MLRRKLYLQVLALVLLVLFIFSGCTVKEAVTDNTKTESGSTAKEAVTDYTNPESDSTAKEAVTDYTNPENWAYYAVGKDHDADLFLVCPTVDMGRDNNFSMSLDNPKMKERFIGALNMEKGIYEDTLTMYAPYYRQAAFTAYTLPKEEAAQYFDTAYLDVRAAFLEFTKQTGSDRPFVLAGFSQGTDMLIRLLKEFFDDPVYQDRLIAAYCIGWSLTEDDVKECPWLKPATGEKDLGSIICFTAEAEGIEESLIVPRGIKTIAINPLNWKTDSTVADSSLNEGACFTDYSGSITNEVPNFTGAYINEERGTLIVPDVIPTDYSNAIFPDGVYHLNDYQFFYRNLQSNVALRVETFLAAGSNK